MDVQDTIAKVHDLWSQFEAAPVRTKTVLLVGPHGCGKTQVLTSLAKKENLTRINLNLELSKRLVEVPEKRRSMKVVSMIDDIVDEYRNDSRHTIVDNIELLFSAELQIEPLHILENCGKAISLVAAWPGEFKNGTLIYAEPGHHEYKAYRDFDSFIISLEEG
jgi:ABC-type lipoprotein export system ATPase subunit